MEPDRMTQGRAGQGRACLILAGAGRPRLSLGILGLLGLPGTIALQFSLLSEMEHSPEREPQPQPQHDWGTGGLG